MLISKFENTNVIAEIESLEKKYGFVFPLQYRIFIEKYNGGYTPETKFKVGKISSNIRGFYGFGNSKIRLTEEKLNEAVNNGVFPIAEDSFGNKIMIGISRDIIGKIYFCDHEERNQLSFIADDLKSFFDICKSKKISEDYRMSIEEREAILISKGYGNNITDGIRKLWQAEIDKYKDMVQEEVFI